MTNKWQRVGVVVVSTVAIAVGCGGGSKQEVAEPQPDSVVVDDDVDDDPDIIIPEEKFDEISSFFNRKRRLVTRCFVEAEAAGEVSQNARVKVLVTMTIQRNGKLTNSKIANTTHKSKVLEKCLLDYVKGWTVTSLPRSLDYSYSFGMGEL